MDASAIKAIQAGVSPEPMQEALDTASMAVPHVVVQDGFNLVNIEEHMPIRASLRGSMQTESTESFFAYAKLNGTADAACFIDAGTMSANIIFDVGSPLNPLHCRHKSTLRLHKTLDYTALLRKAGDVSQKDIAEFIEDYNENIELLDKEGAFIEAGRGVGAIRNLDISAKATSNHSVDEMRSSRSSFEEVEASSALPLPAYISFTCTPYEPLCKRTFIFRVGVLTDLENPAFRLRMVREDKHLDDMVKEFKTIIEEGVSKHGIDVFIGSFKS